MGGDVDDGAKEDSPHRGPHGGHYCGEDSEVHLCAVNGGGSILHKLAALPPPNADDVAERLEQVRELVEACSHLGDKNADGETPLCLAARSAAEVMEDTGIKVFHVARLARVRTLLSLRADPNAGDDVGETPLMEAASVGDAELCRVLLEFGADALQPDRTGLVAADFAAGDAAVVRLFNGAAGAPAMGPSCEGLSPPRTESTAGELVQPGGAGGALARAVHAAAAGGCTGSTDAVRALLDAMADPNVGNELGETPLMEAFSSGNAELCSLLFEFGAEALVAPEYQIC
mmetsp:Transcript_114165/g.355507  ORF Transcript_114165/g.355507 Transcript_114165/m.355507 type:complete len:288 (-) Transcript_114165:280-1143(-)|eukprot:CAMPEP_0204585592 /NCGR_PEP_ID=MMETSP0661-20131031/46997_1 /ASSEMBLY_ACC=CAM_ASM_000606 /TAXON_ID=109239 /ORGANISM="Alexandrium margalefi, Strain AMGDE01CS-322" /LENGTH=287 /DNA_ID=CAMNT_0051595153 /DNA_START=46 /DNA_END=909 /DNA_ORIENTATION=+